MTLHLLLISYLLTEPSTPSLPKPLEYHPPLQSRRTETYEGSLPEDYANDMFCLKLFVLSVKRFLCFPAEFSIRGVKQDF